jgi:putative ABC transport system permease protein
MDEHMLTPGLRKGLPLKEPTRIALETIRAHKLRTFLTLLGIILSVATLIIVVALIEGTNRYIADRVANMGANVFLVTQYGIIPNRKAFAQAQRRNRQITWEDFEDLRDNMELPLRVGLETRRTGTVKSGNQSLEDIDLRGVTANIGDMDVEEPARGRYVTDSDDTHRSQVTLIGSDVATRLFPGVDPIGQEMLVDGRPFVVVGVAKPLGTVLGQAQDNFIYMPIQTFLKIYGSNQQGMAINIQSRGPDWSLRTQEEARTLMRARRHLATGEEDSFGIFSASTIMDLWKQLTGAIASTAVVVVSVFLVIGGVVIMNVMLTSVTERTREIGVRKSLGARKRDVLLQFLVESSVLAAFGGTIGVLLAAGLSFLVGATTSVPMAIPLSAVFVSLAVSTAVGLFFGIYPARRAAELDPIEALRHEI